jgi:hypothetical protein
MSIRKLPSLFIVRFFAVLFVTLAVLPFTQPFSTFAAWDLYDVGGHKIAASKEVQEVATIEGILFRLPPDAGRSESIACEARHPVDARKSAPLVLRI